MSPSTPLTLCRTLPQAGCSFCRGSVLDGYVRVSLTCIRIRQFKAERLLSMSLGSCCLSVLPTLSLSLSLSLSFFCLATLGLCCSRRTCCRAQAQWWWHVAQVLLLFAWSVVAHVQPEEEGGKGEGTGRSFPLRPWLKSYTCFHSHSAGLNTCLVATPSYKGVQKM